MKDAPFKKSFKCDHILAPVHHINELTPSVRSLLRRGKSNALLNVEWQKFGIKRVFDGVFKFFYDFLKEDSLLMIKEPQSSERIYGPLNSTFLCLISKKQKAESLEDYRPISCCNEAYKLITKFIACSLRPLLSEITGMNKSTFSKINRFMM